MQESIKSVQLNGLVINMVKQDNSQTFTPKFRLLLYSCFKQDNYKIFNINFCFFPNLEKDKGIF